MPSDEAGFPLDWAPDAIIVVARGGEIVHVNDQAASLFGFGHDELLGRSLNSLIPEIGPIVADEDSMAEPVRSATLACVRRDGRRAPASVRHRRTTAEGQVYDVVSVRQADDAARPAAPGGELASLQRDFFSLFNHDVRQSLQSIQFICDSISETAPEPAAVISEIVASVKKLLDTMLRLNETGPTAVMEDNCALGDILSALGRELGPLAQRKGLQLVIDPTEEALRTDPVLLRELLQNLMVNAIRYTREGSVTVRCFPGPAAVRIDVVDTGIGMEDDRLQELIAGPRLAALPPARGGAGLGLAIARRLGDVLACGIEAASKPGAGSRFTVIVPRNTSRLDPLQVRNSGPPISDALATRGSADRLR